MVLGFPLINIDNMKVKLQLFGTLGKLATHEQEILLSGDARVTDLVNSLIKQYGAEFGERINRREMWQIAINGRCHILSAAMETRLKDGDEVSILPLIFGG